LIPYEARTIASAHTAQKSKQTLISKFEAIRQRCNETGTAAIGRFQEALDQYKGNGGNPNETDVIHQLRHCFMRNVYDHLAEEFSNPAKLQETGKTYSQVKDDIIKFEASLSDGELDRKKEIAGYDPKSKREHDYDYEKVTNPKEKRRNDQQRYGDVTKAFMTSRHSTPNRKRTSTDSSIGSSKRGRYSGRRSGERRVSNVKEDDLTREFRQYVSNRNTS
jgi:hypothetical protein